jgi:eukaryotic-like serine/threonine-protein kinase
MQAATAGPARVGPYTLLQELGRGDLGQVLLARTDKGVRVAVKVFRRELALYPQFRARLREEIDAFARVRDPRVTAVVDADVDADLPWLAMQYVPAPALHQALAAAGPLTVPAARHLGMGLAEALAAIHAAGLVHGDLKPGNVLLAHDGPHVTDVGLARAAATTPLTRGGALVGTLGYLAPEQIVHGRAVPASDVFALGSVLLFGAVWRRPFGDGDATAVLHRVLHGAPDLSGLTEDLATVVAACLRHDPARRPGLAQVRETLAAAARADGDAPLPPAAPPPIPVPGPRPHPPTGSVPPVVIPAQRTSTATVPPPAHHRRRTSRAARLASATVASATLVGVLAGTAADTTPGPPAPPAAQAP